MTYKHTLAGDKLIDDQICDILLRLPVKSLLRFKVVSKLWFSLISNPNFIKSHAITQQKTNETLIVLHDHSMYTLNLDSYKIGGLLGFYHSEYFVEEPYNLVVGCYNGFVCVNLADEKTSLAYNNPNLCLWNPATKQSIFVPPNIITYTPIFYWESVITSVSTGFGFDPETNDFKILRVVRVSDQPICAEVYSANEDDWRVLDEPNLIDVNYRFDVCANGFLCYVCSNGMMVFDLNKEVFKTGVNLPFVHDSSVHITDVNDSIAMVAISSNHEGLYGSSKIRLWTLDDNACLRIGGVEAAWTQMLSIDVHTELQFVNVYYNRGDLILECDKNYWFVYDSDKKESRLVLMTNDDEYPQYKFYYSDEKPRRFFKYTGSLFTIPVPGKPFGMLVKIIVRKID